jgi:hypothetical protein
MFWKETDSKILTWILFYAFSIQNDLKEGDVLLPLLFSFLLESTSRTSKENQGGLS